MLAHFRELQGDSNTNQEGHRTQVPPTASPQPLRLQVTRFLLLMSHFLFYVFLSLQKAYFSSLEATSCVGDTCLTSGDNFLGT